MTKVLGCLAGVVLVLLLNLVNPSRVLGQISFMELLQNKQIGETARDFTLKNVSGQNVSMTKYRDGKNAIIFFWATWCPHCREALHELVKDKNAIESKGIKVVLVNLGEGVEEVRSYVKRNNVQYEIFLDVDSSLAEPYGIIGVPTFFFVDKQGIIKSVKHSMPKNYEQFFAE